MLVHRALIVSEKQQKELDTSEKFLLNQQKKLNTQKRNYQHGSKILTDEDATLLLPDETTLKDNADKTLDGLVAHIQERIDNAKAKIASGQQLTKEEENAFLQDLNALENEIKIKQADKYKSGNMAPTEANELRKILTATIDTIASRARKNNVFDSISKSYDELRNKLNDPQTDGYFSNSNLSDAVQQIRTLRSEATSAIALGGELNSLFGLQDKYYNSKKRKTKLEMDDKTAMSDLRASNRETNEAEEKYQLAKETLKLKLSEEAYNKVLQREADLEQEVLDIQKEQQAINDKAAADEAEKLEKERQAMLEQQAKEQEQYATKAAQAYNKALTAQNQLYSIQTPANLICRLQHVKQMKHMMLIRQLKV